MHVIMLSVVKNLLSLEIPAVFSQMVHLKLSFCADKLHRRIMQAL